MRAGLCVAAVAVAALTAGCSSSTQSSPPPATTTTPPTSIGTGAVAAAADTITIKNFAFGAPITVKAGATVTVKNDGEQTHTLSADNNTSFDTGPILGGKSVTFVAPKNAGTYKFHCNIHNMHGMLIVVAA